MNEPFQMNIEEVFRLHDGTTIFAGTLTDGPKTIVRGVYELTIDATSVGRVRIDGERSGGQVPGLRSIETRQRLLFDGDQLKGQRVNFEVLQQVESAGVS